MSSFGVSQSVARVEDLRLLTGTGRYIDDIAPSNAAHAYFFRSPVAHAEIKAIETSDAKAAPGVLGVYTAADLGDELINQMDFNLVVNRDGTNGVAPLRPMLAIDRVRFVGEALAVVIAENLEAARDAAELIEFDYDELPVHTQIAFGGPQIHDEAPENRVFDWAFGDEAETAAAFDAAAHTVKMEIIDNRIISNAMEPRGCYAAWDGARLEFAFGGQGVWGVKAALAAKMSLDPEAVKVLNPDVGGGFGTKAFAYPEYFAVAFAARKLGTSVRWMSDRSEAMLTDNAGRDLVTTAEAAFDADHKLQAIRMHALSNIGAHCSLMSQYIQSELALKVLPGVYDVQKAFFHVEGVFTNTTPVDAYRGAGRPEAIYVMERLMDTSAREMGLDPIELRRKNFIPAAAFPYKSVSGELYDVGNFDQVLDRALIEADIAGFAARKAESAKAGKLRGLGLSYYIESILGQDTEVTKIEFADDGMVDLLVGTQSNGQGHETVYAQFLHSKAGIPFDKIRFIQGDSDLIKSGGGTGGSRSVTMQGNSINKTAGEMVEKFKALAGEEMEVSIGDIEFSEGVYSIAGTDKSVTIMELAEKARAKGAAEYIITESEYQLPARSYPNGAHFAEVEIDPDTGVTACVKYTIVDDFGFLINPALAEGQAHGGVAQGLGQALTEHVVYDEEGQLLTGSFMDYAMPRADDLPMMPFHAELVPSTANEIGMKGCGEAGTVGALAAVTNAALDALWDQGITRVDMPMTPLKIWTLLQTQKIAAQ